MGAELYTTTIDNCTNFELFCAYKAIHEQALYDYGHRGYSGSLAEKPELAIVNQEFVSDEEAEQWILDKNEKWGPSDAIKVKTPTPHRLVGGICSS